jgi:hypothetical protein
VVKEKGVMDRESLWGKSVITLLLSLLLMRQKGGVIWDRAHRDQVSFFWGEALGYSQGNLWEE